MCLYECLSVYLPFNYFYSANILFHCTGKISYGIVNGQISTSNYLQILINVEIGFPAITWMSFI